MAFKTVWHRLHFAFSVVLLRKEFYQASDFLFKLISSKLNMVTENCEYNSSLVRITKVVRTSSYPIDSLTNNGCATFMRVRAIEAI